MRHTDQRHAGLSAVTCDRCAAWSWVARLADPKAGIPYGVALAAAALIVLPDTELFAMTVGS